MLDEVVRKFGKQHLEFLRTQIWVNYAETPTDFALYSIFVATIIITYDNIDDDNNASIILAAVVRIFLVILITR